MDENRCFQRGIAVDNIVQYVTIIDESKGSGGGCVLTHVPSWYLHESNGENNYKPVSSQ